MKPCQFVGLLHSRGRQMMGDQRVEANGPRGPWKSKNVFEDHLRKWSGGSPLPGIEYEARIPLQSA